MANGGIFVFAIRARQFFGAPQAPFFFALRFRSVVSLFAAAGKKLEDKKLVKKCAGSTRLGESCSKTYLLGVSILKILVAVGLTFWLAPHANFFSKKKTRTFGKLWGPLWRTGGFFLSPIRGRQNFGAPQARFFSTLRFCSVVSLFAPCGIDAGR